MNRHVIYIYRSENAFTHNFVKCKAINSPRLSIKDDTYQIKMYHTFKDDLFFGSIDILHISFLY